MELKIFLRVLLKRWWIIAILLVITVVSTSVFIYFQTPIYSSSATYVVSPSPDAQNANSYLNGLSVLGGQPTVTNTYASIAASAAVKQSAGSALGLAPFQIRNMIVTSRVQNETNIIEITVEGDSPMLVQALANKVGESTIDYVSKLKGVYVLQLLDAAVIPEAPIKPNKKLYLALGAGLGLVLGGIIALLAGMNEY